VWEGGLSSYATSLVEQYRRVASYADKIRKGAKPSDMPVEHPTAFELVINPANALGLTIPPALLQRATRSSSNCSAGLAGRCSCGWTREAISEWAARSIRKLHPQMGPAGRAHVTRVEGPGTLSVDRSSP
jgi:hypothetical protein